MAFPLKKSGPAAAGSAKPSASKTCARPCRPRFGSARLGHDHAARLNVNFLRKPGRKDLLADCDLIKVGKRLVVGEVTIREAGDEEPIAHLTSTYSVPPRR